MENMDKAAKAQIPIAFLDVFSRITRILETCWRKNDMAETQKLGQLKRGWPDIAAPIGDVDTLNSCVDDGEAHTRPSSRHMSSAEERTHVRAESNICRLAPAHWKGVEVSENRVPQVVSSI